MQILNEEDGKKLENIFDKHLNVYSEENEEVMTKFIKYLKRYSLECIITDKKKITFTYGKRVSKYLGMQLECQLKENAICDHFHSGRSTHLKIADRTYIRSVYYYETLGSNKPNGNLYLFYPHSKSEYALDLMLLIK